MDQVGTHGDVYTAAELAEDALRRLGCDFPVAALKELRSQAAADADQSDDETFVRTACAFVLAVDRLRLAHEDLTGCKCWYEALKV